MAKFSIIDLIWMENLKFMHWLCVRMAIAHNGKSIGEVREKEEL